MNAQRLAGTGIGCPECGQETDGLDCPACGFRFGAPVEQIGTVRRDPSAAPTPERKPLEHYSYSCLACLEECPRRWQAKYHEGLKEPTSSAALRGTLVHEAVEAYTRHCVQHRYDTDMREAGKLADACPDSDAAKIIRSLADVLLIDPGTVIADGAGVEREFEQITRSGYKVVGRYDRLDWNPAEGELIVTDYKSGRGYRYYHYGYRYHYYSSYYYYGEGESRKRRHRKAPA